MRTALILLLTVLTLAGIAVTGAAFFIFYANWLHRTLESDPEGIEE